MKPRLYALVRAVEPAPGDRKLVTVTFAHDSDAGRDYSAAITAVMHGAAFAQSARVARDHGGAFPGYEKTREPMLRVMRKHRQAVEKIDSAFVPYDLMTGARAWILLAEGAETDVDALVARTRGRDPDLWVIELEDRAGRTLLDQDGLSD